MDLHDLKQWRNQHESEQQAKTPILLVDPHNQQQQPSGFSAFPLFLHEPNSKISNSNLSAFPDSNIRFTRMGSYFSLAQWQELELQTLIYRYMLAGIAVPSELLQSFKKSLLRSPPYFLHQSLQQYPHYQPAWYWGRAATDPEPGRCRRTDGKKWRCSRDVVAGQKYCGSHVHRGRNRSRKPVEMPTSGIISTTAIITNNNATAPAGGDSGAGVGAIGCGAIKASSPITASPLAMVATPNNFGHPRPSPPIDLLHPNHSCSESKNEQTGLFEAQNVVQKRSNCHVLRHFFDDWPRSPTRA